jgi:hypothetical protein
MAPDSNATKKTPENLFFIDLKQRVKKRNPLQLMDNLDTRERSRETPGNALPPGCSEIWVTSARSGTGLEILPITGKRRYTMTIPTRDPHPVRRSGFLPVVRVAASGLMFAGQDKN